MPSRVGKRNSCSGLSGCTAGAFFLWVRQAHLPTTTTIRLPITSVADITYFLSCQGDPRNEAAPLVQSVGVPRLVALGCQKKESGEKAHFSFVLGTRVAI